MSWIGPTCRSASFCPPSPLSKLDTYIAHCDAVVHLIGEMTGSAPGEKHVQELLRAHPDLPAKIPPLADALAAHVTVSYTQWEAWLALYHGKRLVTAEAEPFAEKRGPAFAPTDASRAAQKAHLGRLKQEQRYPGCTFANPAELAAKIAYSAILDLLVKQYAETAAKGRDVAETTGKQRHHLAAATNR